VELSLSRVCFSPGSVTIMDTIQTEPDAIQEIVRLLVEQAETPLKTTPTDEP